ncbi:MAG: hypothetical protein IPM95_08475 [Sphingobacteriales bacterium]|nr:hypothetical protein [Sphingobacteriales bacterium]
MKPEESLDIIQNMIETSKKKISDSSKHYLLWGWAVFLSAIAQYIMIKMHYPGSTLVWLSMPLTGIIAYLIGRAEHKKAKVITFAGEAIKKLWLSMTIGFILLAYYQVGGHGNSIPIFILLYGIGILTTGSILSFKPLIAGGIACFIISFIGMQIGYSAYQLLLLALAALVSYLIPGYLLRAESKKAS